MGKKYVVLYGSRGVSREFRTPNAARRYAQEKANKKRNMEVTIDQLTIKGKDFSQSHYANVKPQSKSKIRKKRRINRNPFGFGRMPNFW